MSSTTSYAPNDVISVVDNLSFDCNIILSIFISSFNDVWILDLGYTYDM